MKNEKPTLAGALPGGRSVAVYSASYLNLSETFIQRQVIGIEPRWSPFVLTNDLRNSASIKTERVISVRRSLGDRIAMRLSRRLAKNYEWLPSPLLQRYVDVLANQNARLIHAHFAPAGFEMAAVAKTLRIPLIVTFHGWDASSLLRSAVACRAILKLSEYAKFICVSDAVKAKLIRIGVPKDRLTLHYIGLPLPDFPNSGSEQPRVSGEERVILHVGRMVEKKGVDYTLRAFKALRTSTPNVKLLLVGDGPLLGEMKQLATALALGDAAVFLGPLPNTEVRRLMGMADVFVLHSVTAADGDEEGLPIVLMEAMAMRRPVVSTYHSGIPELINDEENGFLVNERAVEQYTQAMKKALVATDALKSAARSTIECRFSAETQNARLADIYDEACLPDGG